LKNKNAQDSINSDDIPSDYVEILKDYSERLISWPQFKDLAYTEITSGMLQILLKALLKIDMKMLKQYIKRILDESFCTNNDIESAEHSGKLPDVFMSKPAIMLFETMIETAIPKHYTQIYAKCFKGRIRALAILKSTNFAVQKLLMHCKEKVEFEELFDELSNHFEEIISAGNTGVILALAQTCKRLAAKQANFVQVKRITEFPINCQILYFSTELNQSLTLRRSGRETK
ncbi:hypothetical protein AMK59_3741, partial [Oryctes borbonicus]